MYVEQYRLTHWLTKADGNEEMTTAAIKTWLTSFDKPIAEPP